MGIKPGTERSGIYTGEFISGGDKPSEGIGGEGDVFYTEFVIGTDRGPAPAMGGDNGFVEGHRDIGGDDGWTTAKGFGWVEGNRDIKEPGNGV